VNSPQQTGIDPGLPRQTDAATPPESGGETLARRAWRALLQFLEIIGLRREDTVDHALQVARLRLYHTEFRKLISANHSFLENLGELDAKLQGGELTDRPQVKRKVIRLISDIHAMVESINAISSDRYAELRSAFERITASLSKIIEEATESPSRELLLDMSEVSAAHAELAGGKMAHLCELANILGLPTPDGFVVTTEGYRYFLEDGGIRSWIQETHLEPVTPHDADRLSRTLQDRILSLPVPPALAQKIEQAYDRLARRLGTEPTLAARSSAVGEDSDFSFAGQFLSLLNVPREHLCDAYRRIVASLYSNEAVQYRLLHGIPGESAQMAVGFIAMVEAAASGVVFSRDPTRPDSGKVLIQAVKGLGVLLVDGKTSPEVIHVSRDAEAPEILRVASAQTSHVVFAPGLGVQEVEMSDVDAAKSSLTDDEALQLARWAVQLETHFGVTQDIEWAMDSNRRLILLQSRPLRLAAREASATRRPLDLPLLLDGGETGCPGVGTGPAVHMSDDDDTESFPEGGILVARRSSPRFIRLMSKARAIVTDAGSTTGHMASLAREFRIPTLLNTGNATRVIPNGAIVTVDAGSGFVYEGEAPDLIDRELEKRQEADSAAWRRNTPGFRFLKSLWDLISPLNLTDPGSASFTADGCRTLHDMARYIHEKSYREMFMLGDNVGDLRASSYYLDIFLPIDLYVLDLGGGLSGTPKKRKIKRADIASAPLSALLKGMLHEKIPRFGARPIDLRGFASIVMRHAITSPEEESSFRDPCYAIISDNYLNYTARVGYHFSVVDTYCGLTQNKNYISMVFHGGAADIVRRARRAKAIAGILKEHGFTVKLEHDLVSGRLSKTTREETVQHLEMLGSLLQFFRQMDAAMTSDDAVDIFKDAFLKGDYALEEISRS